MCLLLEVTAQTVNRNETLLGILNGVDSSGRRRDAGRAKSASTLMGLGKKAQDLIQ